MRLLLDTQAWLWMIGPQERLSPASRDLLADPENELFVSAASLWEISIKAALGKLRFPGPPSVYLPPAIRRSGVKVLPVSAEHAIAVADLPSHHRDPFDRMLVAQAQVEELTIMTADQSFALYDVGVQPP